MITTRYIPKLVLHFVPAVYMQVILLTGIGASVLTGISMLPQLVKVIKEKKADDISYMMLVVLLTGLALWSTYGILKKDWIILISNSFSFTVNLALLFISRHYKKSTH